MVQLTPDMAGNSLIVMGIIYLVTIAFSLYQLYLNWKQAKVNEQMDRLIEGVGKVNERLDRLISIVSVKRR